jgi:hypothetical protein
MILCCKPAMKRSRDVTVPFSSFGGALSWMSASA